MRRRATIPAHLLLGQKALWYVPNLSKFRTVNLWSLNLVWTASAASQVSWRCERGVATKERWMEQTCTILKAFYLSAATTTIMRMILVVALSDYTTSIIWHRRKLPKSAQNGVKTISRKSPKGQPKYREADRQGRRLLKVGRYYRQSRMGDRKRPLEEACWMEYCMRDEIECSRLY